METLGDIIMALSVLTTFAALGISTLLAFAMMGALGLVTEMSFKRIFFISFGAALILPILVGISTVGVVQDDQTREELAEFMRDALPSSERLAEEIDNLAPITEEELRGLEDGTITEAEIEQRVEERIQRFLPGADVQIGDDEVRITTPDDSVNITID